MSNHLLDIDQPTGRILFNSFSGGKLGWAVQITSHDGYVQLSEAQTKVLVKMLKGVIDHKEKYSPTSQDVDKRMGFDG